MIGSIVPARALQAADTVVAVQAQGWLDAASDIALLVLTLALTVAAVGVVLFLRHLQHLQRSVRRAVRKAEARAGPLLERGADIADNLEFVTRALRTDVERLTSSVKALSDRLGQASDRMEERIEDFNALMEVVQSEAEAIFIDTASTVRGVRAGARSMGDAAPADPEPRLEGEDPEAEGVYLTRAPDEGGDVDPERRKEA